MLPTAFPLQQKSPHEELTSTALTLLYDLNPAGRRVEATFRARPLRPSFFNYDPPLASNLLVNETIRAFPCFGQIQRTCTALRLCRPLLPGLYGLQPAKAQSPKVFLATDATSRPGSNEPTRLIDRESYLAADAYATCEASWIPDYPHSHSSQMVDHHCLEGWLAALFFCLTRLSRHYLPPVADYGEKQESEVRKSPTVQKR